MFKHYLITRFNLRADYWDVTKNNEQLLTDEWMNNRMWLFENFCFPSVVGQTNQNFEWLLYFDTNTKEVYQNRIQELVANQPNFKVFFVDAMPSFMPELHNYITNESKDKPYLITTRIDNDDSIHIDFINEVQKQFNQQEYQAIDFIKGYSLQIEPNYILGKKEQLFNPFISLIEKNENPKTAFHQDHRFWKRDKKVTQLGEKRLWLSIIHQRNKINRFDGYGNVKCEKLKNVFILSKEANNLISKKIIPVHKWIFTNLKNLIAHKLDLNYKLLKRKIGFYKLK
ncbi:MAG: glycosyltransferase [Flavobacterium sp.]|uniref:glycosyltransferase n=1 Tax=Flavobacterium sp. TaxID=239 RepID=UPI003BE2B7CB